MRVVFKGGHALRTVQQLQTGGYAKLIEDRAHDEVIGEILPKGRHDCGIVYGCYLRYLISECQKMGVQMTKDDTLVGGCETDGGCDTNTSFFLSE